MSIAHKLQMGGTIAAVFFGVVCAAAKQPKQPAPAAPVPEQILTAKTIFISNEGAGCAPFEKGGFPGGPNRAYNEFYQAMKQWGRYRLAGAPADADLEFEIGFSCPSAGAAVMKVRTNGTSIAPQFRLRIRDVRTGMPLWSITEYVKPPGVNPLVFVPVAGAVYFFTGLKKSEMKRTEKQYEAAMGRLVNDVKTLTAQH